MKNTTAFQSFTRLILLAAITFVGLPKGRAQTFDTLHVYYNQTSTKLADSSSVKIDKWIKKLNGKHVDLQVLAYYSKADYKKFSIERADELYLVLNRKARSLFTIQFIGPKKGENFQRTTVDIVYSVSMTPEEKAAIAAKAEDAKKADADKVAADKAKKEADKKERSAADKKPKDKKETTPEADDTKKETAGDKKKKDKKEEGTDDAKKETASDKKKGKEPAKGKEDGEEDENKSTKVPVFRDGGTGLSVSAEEVAMIKNANIVITTINTASVDSILVRAVREYWTFNKNITVMPYSKAFEMAKEDKNMLLLFTTTMKSRTVTHSGGRYTEAKSKALVLEKGKRRVLLCNFFPRNEDGGISQENVDFAVTAMNSLLVNMDEQKISKVKRVNTPFEKNSAQLKERTLLINSDDLKKGLEQEISSHYHANFKVVNYDTYKEAILKKQPYAYVMPVPYSVGGSIMYYDYIVDAETGLVYYINQPSMFSNMAKIPDPLGNVHDLARNDRISAKNLEKYNKAFEKDKKKGKDDEEEAKETPATSETPATEETPAKPAKTEKKKKSKDEAKEIPATTDTPATEETPAKPEKKKKGKD